jgi:hypothetical protein
MRKAARIAGIAWLALMALAGAFLWAAETMAWVGPVSSNRGLIYIVFGACLPGVLLYRWGRKPYDPVSRAVAIMRDATGKRETSKKGVDSHA